MGTFCHSHPASKRDDVLVKISYFVLFLANSCPVKGNVYELISAHERFEKFNKGIKSIELLVSVSFMSCDTSTPDLSTSWSRTTLKGALVLRLVSRLDAFSGYPFRT